MLRSAILTTLLGVLAACSTPQTGLPEIAADVPRTSQPFADDPQDFHFVIVGDRTGGHRPGVFRDALGKVNMLRPEFVISVGDLIEGYTEDRATIAAQWDEIDAMLRQLDMPFFYVVGNHDISNPAMADAWRERLGASWYSFTYKGVLFIALNTEEPPKLPDAELLASTRRLEEMMAQDPDGTQALILESARERPEPVNLPGSVSFGEEQLAFVEQTLAANPAPRWTVLLMHKPAWEYDSAEFARIETILGERPYTVFAGHEHYYAYSNRKGRGYVTLATTGGVWLRDGPGRFDHVAWVTMTDDGPQIANISTAAISGKEGPDGE